jgi:hypothetical protein
MSGILLGVEIAVGVFLFILAVRVALRIFWYLAFGRTDGGLERISSRVEQNATLQVFGTGQRTVPPKQVLLFLIVALLGGVAILLIFIALSYLGVTS